MFISISSQRQKTFQKNVYHLVFPSVNHLSSLHLFNLVQSLCPNPIALKKCARWRTIVNRRKHTYPMANRIFQNDNKYKLSWPMGRSNLDSDHLYRSGSLHAMLFDLKKKEKKKMTSHRHPPENRVHVQCLVCLRHTKYRLNECPFPLHHKQTPFFTL